VFILGCILIIVYIIMKVVYPPIKKSMTPEGKRIKHKELRGYLKQKYGDDEGKGIYKDFVKMLRRRGYY
jgi:hypothetical protein